MGIALMHRLRRIGGVLALIGVVFYAALLPWHTVSQANLALAGFEPGVKVEAPCHEAAAADSETSKTSKPANPKTHCPVCSGFAAPTICGLRRGTSFGEQRQRIERLRIHLPGMAFRDYSGRAMRRGFKRAG